MQNYDKNLNEFRDYYQRDKRIGKNNLIFRIKNKKFLSY